MPTERPDPDNLSESPSPSASVADPDNAGTIPVPMQLPDSPDLMTLREKIGQMMVPAFRTSASGLPLLQADAATLSAINTWRPGGVVLFSQNLDTVPQTVALIRQLQGASEIPLLMGVDEEGGLVSRLSSAKRMGAVSMPSAFTIGSTGDASLATEAATAIARQLGVLGFNLDFAPVADVHTNPANPVIGKRAYGTTPQLVSQMVLAAMEGFGKERIIPVVKHFPGHGDTQTDSHVGLAVVPHERERMDAVELAPFRAAIAAGIPCVMTAHVTTPGLSDSGLPATLNPEILTDLLRNELQFDGVIFTDAMEMGAITEYYGEAESIVMAVEAGADMLLVPVSLERACEALLRAVSDGRISEARIDASVQRILTLKRNWNLLERTQDFQREASETSSDSSPEAIPDTDAYRDLVERIEAAATVE